MLTITQSQDITQLFYHLVADMKRRNATGELGVFDQYTLIVPATSVKTWIMNELATRQGISSMVHAKFWGSYQWQLLETVLDAKPLSADEMAELPSELATYYKQHYRLVPKNPNLSIQFMQWRIFGFLKSQFAEVSQLSERQQHAHVLYDFFEKDLAFEKDLTQDVSVNYQNTDNKQDSYHQNTNNKDNNKQQSRWWQLAQKIAQVFSGYLTHRPDWLQGWSSSPVQSLDIAGIIQKKDNFNQQQGQSATPDWLISRYEAVNAWQQYIWTALFVEDFNYRQALLSWFWQKLRETQYQQRLPAQICFFTLPPVPKEDLNFIRRLASFTDIHFLHYNPSMEYWADIADPFWLGQQKLTIPERAWGRETGHFLLARMGKQARDTFKLIADIAGGIYSDNEQIVWQDDFIEQAPQNLLQRIQQDILLLDENNSLYNGELTEADFADDSIRINACHSSTRQLEILREDIVVWLNGHVESSSDEKTERQPSDIIVMLPDLANYEAVIRSVFPNHTGIDGFLLPAKLTGMADSQTQLLWQALLGRYQLLQGRLGSEALFGWLMLPPVYASVDLTHEQMQRGTELLTLAGFKRGFDAEHIATWLAGGDGDDRFTFRYALDRLVMGLLMPEADMFAYENHDDAVAESPTSQPLVNQSVVLPLDSVTLDDAPIIQGLVRICADLQACHIYSENGVDTKRIVKDWINDVLQMDLETHFAEYRGQLAWQDITSAFMNLSQSSSNWTNQQSLAVSNDKKSNDKQSDEQIKHCSLDFVLNILSEMLATDMRGSEPTGAITFCRIGTVRPLPFKLVVLLNMNIGEYPVREQPNHFDLMQAGLVEVGDRQREEDETGAFLDALMMAKQSCWFYYNGFSTSDTHQHLPANPLQELMMFLEDIYRKFTEKQVTDNNELTVDTDNIENKDLKDSQTAVTQHTDIPQFIAHPALPFEADSFKAGKAQRHQGFWFDIYQRLHEKSLQEKSLHINKQAEINQTDNNEVFSGRTDSFIDWTQPVSLPNYKESFCELYANDETVFVDGKRLFNDVAKPAQHFLYSQQIRIPDEEETLDSLEPLTLDNLSEYNLRKILLDDYVARQQTGKQSMVHQMISEHSSYKQSSDAKPDYDKQFDESIKTIENHAHFASQLYDNNLPAGVVKSAYYEKSKRFVTAQIQDLLSIAPDGVTPTQETLVTVAQHHITYGLPTQLDISVWASIVPTSASDTHVLKQYLAHLLWQVARDTSKTQIDHDDGMSICVFKSDIKRFRPVLAQTAFTQLKNWLAVWQYNKTHPVVLPPTWGMKFAKQIQQDKQLAELNLTDWLQRNQSIGFLSDGCSQHPTWQLILQGANQREQLLTHAEVLAETLYLPLLVVQI